ncbi:ComF family protein [uncultured Bacteroides sp.]|uniref:ComF family protein n=1 Tax=uncultured Bacteroides sp. TaxID=162156 RepID=UPI002AAB59B5|nr:ComF family protein [uncultured Bacteroides sp.]
MIEWIKSIFALFFPRCCVVCGNPLLDAEEVLCVKCNMDMPRTGYHFFPENPAERLFWGKIRIERATSFFFYLKGSDYKNILYDLKYRGNKKLGETMGRFIATELCCSHFFEGIDVIIPVPLHPDKKIKRGYNQSDWIAKGVAAVSGISVNLAAVTRIKDTETQTKKTNFERWENVSGIFELISSPSCFEGKHILIIDDVLTTGATIIACASAFNGISNLRVSVLTLAMAM